jgi:hypothetical protein
MASPTTNYTNAVVASRTKAVENVLPRLPLTLTLNPQLHAIAKAIDGGGMLGHVLDAIGLIVCLAILFAVRA